jgi:hypothetical protein
MSCASFYGLYLRWLRHLGERFGWQNTLSIWQAAYVDYDDTFTWKILSSGWKKVTAEGKQPGEIIQGLFDESFSFTHLGVSNLEVRNLVDLAPPIAQIKQLYSLDVVEKDIPAYDALHIRFDGLACLAEGLMVKYGKQAELVIYDLMVESRLASAKGETGSVEQFIQNFASEEDSPSLFTAGLTSELISQSRDEVVLHIRECEWARYFRDRHPQVGYLLACSTDEVAYKAYNQNLRMQRTQTLMEGDQMCDFRIYAVEKGM